MHMATPNDPIRLHSAGATVRHKGPFSELVVPSSDESLSPEFCARWVSPFYMNFLGLHFLKPGIEVALRRVYPTIDQKVIEALLSEFNWRPRIVGGHFAAIKNVCGVEHLLGTLLLRSDVCFAAEGYCVALARFNSERSRVYFADYLDYYLTRRDLEFDQGTVMCALGYLDRLNGRNDLDRFIPKWQEFIGSECEPGWNLDQAIASFSMRMERVYELAGTCS
jgi:hypothetical protein